MANKTASSNPVADKDRAIALGNTLTRHQCECGCNAFIPLKDLFSIKSMGSGHARMKFYIRGHENRTSAK